MSILRMCSHSKTLFKMNDGRPMNFAVLNSSFDANIVSTLIQWGGGSVNISENPIKGAITLSCKKLAIADQEIFNTAFIYACCVSNRLYDLRGFSFGRSLVEKDTKQLANNEKKSSSTYSETSKSQSLIKEPSQELLRKWLNDTSCGAGSSHGNKEGIEEEKEDESMSGLSDATTCSPDYFLGQLENGDSEILPEDSASAAKYKNIDSSSEVLRTPDGMSPSVHDDIESQIDRWLRDSSPDTSDS